MEAESNVRKWAGWLLGAAVALQFYFVQELLAALALFAIGFAAVALMMVGLYGLQKGWGRWSRVFSASTKWRREVCRPGSPAVKGNPRDEIPALR